ncbi:hypothetical protein OG746_45220 [Streptomyces sp. NBC_01016]|uniref:hypothetical protein n=1 Tax=Streptomyces sp. NBC_01016 TaxID=2903720 RepID=UPI0022596511|nr:hypothetical protein [Streptomyces sp. NBC_01016]MCX4835917.1 hypothetical protein [Streptomyces sp. NBC_01016]
MVVVTSRRMLTGLESVHRIPLGELSPDEAAAFLTTLVGPERAQADPAALADVARCCRHLRLALRVAAAFDLSYRQLTPAGARLFRRLSLVPGPDTGAPPAARLTGQHLYDAEDTPEELVEAGLLGTDRDR